MSKDLHPLLDERSPVPLETTPWTNKWIPCCPGFWRYHFGTDLLLASWLFFLSSALWVGMEADVVASESVHRFFVAFNHDLTLGSACAFTIGSAYFVYLSYPEELANMKQLLKSEDAKALSFVERYFTGSDMLIATWFFAAATLPFLVFGCYAMISEPTSYVGYAYVVLSSLTFAALSVWVIASMPENLQANNGYGSTKFYNAFFKKGCCARCCATVARRYWHTDMLLGMWLFAVGAVCLLPCAIYVCIAYPDELNSWLDLIIVVSFALGAVLMTYTSYHENEGSTLVADALSGTALTKTH